MFQQLNPRGTYAYFHLKRHFFGQYLLHRLLNIDWYTDFMFLSHEII